MIRRWHWGRGIALVYTTFAAGTVGMVVLATQQRVDLVAPDYYAQSLAHDARTAAIENARALGDAFTIDVSGDARTVRIAWPRDQIAGLSGAIVLYRPADASRDRTTAIAPDAAGAQTITLAGEPAGAWRLQVQWAAADRTFYAERALVVR
jgi:nitrogen fixation protein FixH